MIPIRDTIPSSKKPVVNYTIIILTIFVFYLQLSAGSGSMYLVDFYAFLPKQLFNLIHHGIFTFEPIKRMFTSMFLHGSLFHLIGNMLYLYIFGDNVEDRLGHFAYILFYIFCGIVAAFFHYLFNPISSVPTLGASGAVAGVMGAYFIFFPKSRILTLIPIFIFFQFIEIPAVFFLLFWFIMQILYGSVSITTGLQNVAWWAHVGGFLTGAIIGLIVVFFEKIRKGI